LKVDGGGTSEAVEQTARQTEAGAAAEEPELAAHPGPRQYVFVAIWLAIATAIEVAWYYLDVPHALFATLLLILAFVKFSLVVLWFMHLRFDSSIFRRLFVTGLLLAITVYVIVLVIFGALNAPWLLAAVLLVGAAVLAGFVRTGRSPIGHGAGSAGHGSTGH
jgi:cytochrome c oxidase subunit 4